MTRAPQALALTALPGIGEVLPGADLGRIIADRLLACGPAPKSGTVIVVAQKIISKAENRYVLLDKVVPSQRALELAQLTGKDPALVEVVLSESTEVVRAAVNTLIVRHKLGYVVANAGIDQSNVRSPDGHTACLLLPADPQASALGLRRALAKVFDPAPAVIISDSFGRPWRHGVVNVALGSSGLPALIDRRGEFDRYGRRMNVTQVALADALAAAAGIVMGEGDEGTPVVLVTGGRWTAPENGALDLVRPASEDLFR